MVAERTTSHPARVSWIARCALLGTINTINGSVKLVSSTDYTVALPIKLKRDGLLQNQRVTRVCKLGRLLGSTLWVTHSVLQKFPDHTNSIHEHTSSFGTKLEGPSNNGLGISVARCG